MIEINELGHELNDLFRRIKTASIGWNGTAPLRCL